MKPRLMLGLALLTLTATGWAQTSPLPNWDQLTPQQREALIAPVRDRWNDAPPPQRERMLQHGQRWQEMTPEQRDLARRGRHRFENMSPEQREQARALFAQMRTMNPAQRDELRARWARMTPDQRQDWLKANPIVEPPAAPRKP
ncbi:MAG TPA: hypothetical protein DEB32_02545 [Stenotrophomonas sp.]|jgi:hypothetical protein|uniref:DUF3106 domain-containing protein n=2 Tax=Stenotrophomonas TaxID=40323 RepID=A0A4S2D5Y3_STEMA|nr:DUF3106 domain-containing protein [Stenotrophomonas sp.]QIO87042.1 hypothetical protein G9274_000727 [Stenotrophomonas rhizophila]TGY36033.1 DUF3106 domain-containing protein [Stenotrophomonas maltophilia]HBS61613.1 hypothetical protein [Stenotrophomonas sp.]